MKTPLILRSFFLCAGIAHPALASSATQNAHPDVIGITTAQDDVVLEWNAAVSAYFDEFSGTTSPHIQARVYAMTHLAVRDAIANVVREARRDSTGPMAKAAAATAAHDVLTALMPAGATRFALLESRQRAAWPNDADAARGRQIGQRAAASLTQRRMTDGWPVMLSRLHPQNTAAAALLGAPPFDSRFQPRINSSQPVPFGLKRVQQFKPELPYFAYADGVVLPNLRLRNTKLLGMPPDLRSAGQSRQERQSDPIVHWNRIAHALAAQQPADPLMRARVFALLNTALADALLSASFWTESYRHGRTEVQIEIASAQDAFAHDIIVSKGPPHPEGKWRVAEPLAGFPAIPAALAGAAETVLKESFGGSEVTFMPGSIVDASSGSAGAAPVEVTSLRRAARECAWAALLDGGTSLEACVAGFDLGTRIGAHLLKQTR